MITNKIDNYNPDYAVHPGATLAETLEVLNMTQSELSKRTDRPEKTISEIINGQASITPETAIQFELALGVPASFWNALEKNYREILAKIDAKKRITEEIHLARKYPYNIMAKLGWVPQTRIIEERVQNLLKYFRVTSLALLPDLEAVAFKQIKNSGHSSENLVTWLRQGEVVASRIETAPFDRAELIKSLPKLRELTNTKKDLSKKMRQICSDCGVALVFIPYLPKTYVNGASRWMSSDKALIQLSLRGSFNDLLWFTLFHELGHLLLHSKKEKFIDFEPKKSQECTLETEADEFASKHLISSKVIEEFLANSSVNKENIINLAHTLGIHPGIVVGRLQHLGVLKFNELNGLRSRYHFIQPT